MKTDSEREGGVMAENVTREDIAEMIEFVRGELSNREFGGHESEYVASARRSLAIAEKLPALVAERDALKEERDDARRLATNALSQAQDWRHSAETARETIAKLREALKATGSVASALLEHFNPTNLAEAVAQQWFALHDQVTVFNAGVLAQLDAAPEPVKWTHSTRGRYEVIIMPADRAPDVECGRERECAIESFEVANDGGKRWRIEARFVDGRSFALKPDGEITATEAERICLRIAAALGFHEAAPDDQAMIDIPVATSLEQALREADRHVARLREYHAAWAEDWDRKLMARAESETVQDTNDGGAM
jgi:hypothetical protein